MRGDPLARGVENHLVTVPFDTDFLLVPEERE